MAIGTDINRLLKLREAKKEASDKLTALEAEYKVLEQSLIASLKTEGTRKASSSHGTFSYKFAMVPQVDNWDLYHGMLIKNKALYMLERRPAVMANREFFEQKGVGIDEDGNVTNQKMAEQLSTKYGLKPFIKISTSLTTTKE